MVVLCIHVLYHSISPPSKNRLDDVVLFAN
jgi:hypothetical protein